MIYHRGYNGRAENSEIACRGSRMRHAVRRRRRVSRLDEQRRVVGGGGVGGREAGLGWST